MSGCLFLSVVSLIVSHKEISQTLADWILVDINLTTTSSWPRKCILSFFS